MIWLVICCLVGIVLLGWKCYTLSKQKTEILTHNTEQEKINQNLTNKGIILQGEIDSYQKDILRKQEEFKRISASIEEIYENNQQKKRELLNKLDQEIAAIKKESLSKLTVAVDEEYEQHKENLEHEYNEVVLDLQTHVSLLLNSIKQETQKLRDLQDKQETYIKEQQHKEEMLAKKDYYRLNLSQTDEQDIEMLRNLQTHLTRKEAIDKIIWEVYYKSAYDTLMSHLFSSSERVCGIYKITCLENDKAYIGQSLNIKERLRQHIKTALSCAPSTNKLYQEMKKFQPSNFLFEVLEIVPQPQLNERETYWINFYKTKDYGLNKTQGGS